jgi:hypothetical protein
MGSRSKIFDIFDRPDDNLKRIKPLRTKKLITRIFSPNITKTKQRYTASSSQIKNRTQKIHQAEQTI